MPTRAAPLLLVALVLGVTGCDQASKGWAERELQGTTPTSIVSSRVQLEYTRNPGAAFSLERVVPEGARRPLLVAVGIAGVGLLAFACWRQRRAWSMQAAGYAVLLGGAAGNLLDRFTRGYVVDFVHVRGWPVFNVADVAIGAGAALLVLDAIRRRPAAAQT